LDMRILNNGGNGEKTNNKLTGVSLNLVSLIKEKMTPQYTKPRTKFDQTIYFLKNLARNCQVKKLWIINGLSTFDCLKYHTS
jgi:hypothetical protein